VQEQLRAVVAELKAHEKLRLEHHPIVDLNFLFGLQSMAGGGINGGARRQAVVDLLFLNHCLEDGPNDHAYIIMLEPGKATSKPVAKHNGNEVEPQGADKKIVRGNDFATEAIELFDDLPGRSLKAKTAPVGVVLDLDEATDRALIEWLHEQGIAEVQDEDLVWLKKPHRVANAKKANVGVQPGKKTETEDTEGDEAMAKENIYRGLFAILVEEIFPKGVREFARITLERMHQQFQFRPDETRVVLDVLCWNLWLTYHEATDDEPESLKLVETAWRVYSELVKKTGDELKAMLPDGQGDFKDKNWYIYELLQIKKFDQAFLDELLPPTPAVEHPPVEPSAKTERLHKKKAGGKRGQGSQLPVAEMPSVVAIVVPPPEPNPAEDAPMGDDDGGFDEPLFTGEAEILEARVERLAPAVPAHTGEAELLQGPPVGSIAIPEPEHTGEPEDTSGMDGGTATPLLPSDLQPEFVEPIPPLSQLVPGLGAVLGIPESEVLVPLEATDGMEGGPVPAFVVSPTSEVDTALEELEDTLTTQAVGLPFLTLNRLVREDLQDFFSAMRRECPELFAFVRDNYRVRQHLAAQFVHNLLPEADQP